MKQAPSFYRILFLFFLFPIQADQINPEESFYIGDDIDQQTEGLDLDDKIQRSCTSDPENTLKLLVAVNAPGILSRNVFLRTNQTNKRELTYEPTFLLFHSDYRTYQWLTRIYLFYNQTPRVFFTSCGTTIESYLALTDNNFLKELEEIDLENLAGINIRKTLALFKNMRIEERRAGLMFQLLRNWNKISLEFTVPFLYQERNFNFPEQDIINIKQSNLFEQEEGGTVASDKQQEKEFQKHVISDQVGFSDLKIKLGYSIIHLPCRNLLIGIEGTIPTAFALKNGILGSDFYRDLCPPQLHIQQLLDIFNPENPTQKAEGQEIARDLLVRFANRLGAMLLQTPLGDYKHASLGIFIEPNIHLHEHVHINAYAGVRYIFPQNEIRFFIQKKDPKDFNKKKFSEDANSGNIALICRDLNFLDAQAINTLFPTAIKTLVSPNLQLEITIAPHLTFDTWHFSFGYDFWYKQQANLSLNARDVGDPNICKAITPAAYQNKLFARLYKEISSCTYDFAFAVQGEDTISSKGIGKDFTITGSLEFKF